MRLVVDANMLFAALIKDSKTSELLFSENLELYAPPFLFEEFEKYKSFLLNKTKRGEQDFITVLRIFKEHIIRVQEKETQPQMTKAETLGPDKNDVAYFAAALAKNAGIWSNDKRLKQQKNIMVMSTEELLEKISK